MYGVEIARGTYAGQTVLSLASLSITDLGDTEDGHNCIQINHKMKSFQVGGDSYAVLNVLTFRCLRPPLVTKLTGPRT